MKTIIPKLLHRSQRKCKCHYYTPNVQIYVFEG